MKRIFGLLMVVTLDASDITLQAVSQNPTHERREISYFSAKKKGLTGWGKKQWDKLTPSQQNKLYTALVLSSATAAAVVLNKLESSASNLSLDEQLLYAIKNESFSEVKKLINDAADVNARYKNRITPLMWAASTNNLAIVKFLIENDADINAQNSDNNRAIDYAIKHGASNEIQKLLNSWTASGF
jgi:hypothetical protein